VRRRIAVLFAALFLSAVPAGFAATGATSKHNLVQPSVGHTPLLHQLHKIHRAKKRAARPKVSIPPQLQAIAECESHGNPRSIGGGGLYRGKYQMTTSIWASVGGHGDPAAASEREQDLRAALLYNRSGPGQWPVCGQ
jgi:hypothetical protein